MFFAAIFVPDFPVEALIRLEPELRDQAVVVVEGTPPLLRVVAGNQRARDAGVEIGMSKLEAEARLVAHAATHRISVDGSVRSSERQAVLPTHNSQLTTRSSIRRRSLSQETAAHAALIDCACGFSPRVEDDAAKPDMVMLDVSGLERLFGPPARIAHKLARRASELGLNANVAVAANAETAVHAARGFAGITVIPPGEEAERLGTLPVEVLLETATGGDMRTPEGMRAAQLLDTLARWGIRDCRALAALPETAVHQRLGETGVRLQKLARGESSRPLVPADPPLNFEETVELEYPVTLLEPLAFLLNRMLDQICARLEARALATQEIRLCLHLADNADISDLGFGNSDLSHTHVAQQIQNPKSEIRNEHEYTLHLPVPMLDAKVLLKLLQLELRAKPPGAPVDKISLAAEPVHPRFTQGGLFLPAAPEPEKLEVMLAKINAVVSRKSPVASEPGRWSSASRRPSVVGRWPGSSEDVGEAPKAVSSEQLPVEGRRSPDHRIHGTPGQVTRSPDYPDGTTNETCDDVRVGSVELLATYKSDAFRMKKFSPPQPVAGRRSPVAGEQGRWSSASRRPSVVGHWRGSSEDFGEATKAVPSEQLSVEGRRSPDHPIHGTPGQVTGSPDQVGVLATRNSSALRRFRPPAPVRVEVREGRPARIISDLRFSICDLERQNPPQRHRDTEEKQRKEKQSEITNLKSQIGNVVGSSQLTTHNSQLATVLWSSGPWRESGEWWTGEPWVREVWDMAVSHQNGTVIYRIFRDVARDAWFLEAMYD